MRGPGEETADASAPAGLPVALAYLFACTALVVSGIFPLSNADTYGHLAQGRQIFELGHVPLRDAFSFWQAEPARWYNYEWLSDVLTYRLYLAGGPNALIAAKCALLALAGALLIALAQVLGSARAAWVCALLIVAAIPASRFRFTERPHLVALALGALYLLGMSYLVRGWGRGRPRIEMLWIVGLGIAHLAWVNLHGSHLLGLSLTGAQVLVAFRSSARGKLLALLGLQLIASCISPYGPAISLDAIAHVANPAYREVVTEWQGFQASDPLWFLLHPLLQSLALALCVRTLMRRGPAERTLLCAAGLTAIACFRSLRFVAEYLLLSAPALAVALGPSLQPISARRFAGSMVAALALAGLLLPLTATRLPPAVGLGGGASFHGLPAASGAWIAGHLPEARILATIEDSWFLMFAAPRARVLMDGRVPFYGPAHIEHVRAAFDSPHRFEELLAQYRFDTVLVRHAFRGYRALLAAMLANRDFALVSVEDRYALFVRRDRVLREGGRPRDLPIVPSYESEWVFAATPEREAAIRDALAQLTHDNAQGYTGWVRALLALKPLRRPGGDNGVRPPQDARELNALRKAGGWLSRAAEGAGDVPTVHAYRALVSAAICDLTVADEALAQARLEGESRETLLGEQEIALRRGEAAEVGAFLERARTLPDAAGDGWLAALQAGLKQAPRCP